MTSRNSVAWIVELFENEHTRAPATITATIVIAIVVVGVVTLSQSGGALRVSDAVARTWEAEKKSQITKILNGGYGDEHAACDGDRAEHPWLQFADDEAKRRAGSHMLTLRGAPGSSVRREDAIPKYRFLACIEDQRRVFINKRKREAGRYLDITGEAAVEELEAHLPEYLNSKYSLIGNAADSVADAIGIAAAMTDAGIEALNKGSTLVEGSMDVVLAGFNNSSVFSDDSEGRRKKELLTPPLAILNTASSSIAMDEPESESINFYASIINRVLGEALYAQIEPFDAEVVGGRQLGFDEEGLIRPDPLEAGVKKVAGKSAGKVFDAAVRKQATFSRRLMRSASKSLLTNFASTLAAEAMFRDSDEAEIKRQFSLRVQKWRGEVLDAYEELVERTVSAMSQHIVTKLGDGALLVTDERPMTEEERDLAAIHESRIFLEEEEEYDGPADPLIGETEPGEYENEDDENGGDFDRVIEDGTISPPEVGSTPWRVQVASRSSLEAAREHAEKDRRGGLTGVEIVKQGTVYVVLAGRFFSSETAMDTARLATRITGEPVIVVDYSRWCPLTRRDYPVDECLIWGAFGPGESYVSPGWRSRVNPPFEMLEKDGSYYPLYGPYATKSEAADKAEELGGSARHVGGFCPRRSQQNDGASQCSSVSGKRAIVVRPD